MNRAFTILEVLIVVLLLVLIGAVVAPIAVSEIGRTSLEEGKRQVEAGVMLARSDAQRRGVVLRLWASNPGMTEAPTAAVELYTIDLYPSKNEAVSSDRTSSENDRPGASGYRDGTERIVLVLPAGVCVSNFAPGGLRSEGADRAESEDWLGTTGNSVVGETGDEVDVPVLIATCFPDGQVVQVRGDGEGCFVYRQNGGSAGSPRGAGSGRAIGEGWSLRVNSWTGAVTATPVAPMSEDAAKDDEPEPKPVTSKPEETKEAEEKP